MHRLGNTLVLGLGRSGVAAARELLSMREAGEVMSVTVVDTRELPATHAAAEELRELGATVHVGIDSAEGSFDLAVASPGIAPSAAVMRWASAAADEVVSEIELAWRLSDASWVAVTGTNGKTTTTSLIGHLLSSAGTMTEVVGNIGPPAIGIARRVSPGTIIVAEVSSFQLALTRQFKPRVAVLLNITPDHLDWHGTMQAYTADKGRIFANLGRGDAAVVDVDDPGAAPFADMLEREGIDVKRVSASAQVPADGWMAGEGLLLSSRTGPIHLVGIDELKLQGMHNYANALAASLAARALGASADDVREGLRSFTPIEHRLEPVGTIDGAEYFNDSKATNPDAVLKAITAFPDRSIVLIVGGRNKGNEFTSLAAECVGRCRTVVAFGEARDEIASAFSDSDIPLTMVARMSDAVLAARGASRPGDIVVLSPACASFDEFSDFEERGTAFKAIVQRMMAESA